MYVTIKKSDVICLEWDLYKFKVIIKVNSKEISLKKIVRKIVKKRTEPVLLDLILNCGVYTCTRLPPLFHGDVEGWRDVEREDDLDITKPKIKLGFTTFFFYTFEKLGS